MIVEIQPRCYLRLGGTIGRSSAASFEQLVKRDFAGEHLHDAALEAIEFRRIKFEGSEAIFEVERVDDGAGLIGKRVRLHDVHAPRGEHARDGGENQGTVARE